MYTDEDSEIQKSDAVFPRVNIDYIAEQLDPASAHS